MDRLAALGAFVAVADRGGFAAAARHLRASPPAVTRAIAGLEARVGARLLHRTTRAVRLTAEGAAFLPRARAVLDDLAEAEGAVAGARAEPRGRLVVAAPVALGRLHVVPVVAALLAAHPRLSVDLALLDRPVSLAEEGVDVAVRIGGPDGGAPGAPRMEGSRVGEVRRVLVAAPSYLAARGVPGAPADLAGHDVIAFTGVGASDEWRFGPEGRAVVRLRPRLVVNSADAAVAAAEAGLGIARVLSYQAGAAVAAGRLRRVLDEAAPPALPIRLLSRPGRAASAAVRAFVEAASARFGGAAL